ncbi:MAG: alpha-mannosidase, partial [Prevotellaceae bacterium]|nr:alpha-mannosidase [Prevotellaceae bacterium]
MNLRFTIVLMLFAFTGMNAQQNSFIIKNVEPVQYEKKDDALKILSFVKSPQIAGKHLKALLDGKETEIIHTVSPDSILLWLPLIGDTYVLEFLEDGKVFNKQTVSAMIPKDWGYFQRGTIHIIQSSHQDIAWMDTPEYCREERIEDIIVPALDMMQTD